MAPFPSFNLLNFLKNSADFWLFQGSFTPTSRGYELPHAGNHDYHPNEIAGGLSPSFLWTGGSHLPRRRFLSSLHPCFCVEKGSHSPTGQSPSSAWTANELPVLPVPFTASALPDICHFQGAKSSTCRSPVLPSIVSIYSQDDF